MKRLGFYLVLMIISSMGCKQRESARISKRNIVEAVFASGSIITENQYSVMSQADGYLNRSFFNEGDSVKAGQVLFRIENNAQGEQLQNAEFNYKYAKSNASVSSPVLEQLMAQRNQISNKLTTDSINYNRYSKLVQSGAVSQFDYEKAKVSFENSKQDLISINNQIADTKMQLQLEVSKSKANLASQQNTSAFYEIKSEVDGVVFQVRKNKGDLVKRGENLAEIGSGRFIVKLLIVEEDINKLRNGQEVYIELNTEKNKSYKAYLSKIYPYFDSDEQSFIAEATFQDNPAIMKSGTQLQANIKVSEKTNALVIPAEYLLPGDFILDSQKKQKKVVVGIRNSEWVEVLSGVSNDETVLHPKK